jgi:hypothetical protein
MEKAFWTHAVFTIGIFWKPILNIWDFLGGEYSECIFWGLWQKGILKKEAVVSPNKIQGILNLKTSVWTGEILFESYYLLLWVISRRCEYLEYKITGKYFEKSDSGLIEILSQHFTGRTDENQEERQSAQPVPRPRFESNTLGKGVCTVTSMLARSMKVRKMLPVYSCCIETSIWFQYVFFFNLVNVVNC